MWLTLAALALSADPAPDAKDLFARMDETVRRAKTARAEFEVTVDPAAGAVKGRLAGARGNKLRLAMDGKVKDNPVTMEMTADGSKIRTTGGAPATADQEVPKPLTDVALTALARSGVAVPLLLGSEQKEPGEKPNGFDPDKEMAVSDVKAGAKDGDALSVEYKLTVKGAKEPLAVTVWLDPKTRLPVKRVVRGKADKDEFTITETYTKFTLDEELDDKEFELPKK